MFFYFNGQKIIFVGLAGLELESSFFTLRGL